MKDLAYVEDVASCGVRMVDPDRVAAARTAMPAEGDLLDVAEVFALLSDRARLRLIAILTGRELCVCDLAAASGMSESATSHALRILRAHRVVRVRRSGRMAFYSLADDHVRQLVGIALAHVAHGATADSRPMGAA